MSFKETYSGKYKAIISAIALFLIFDLAVLALNFYLTTRINDEIAYLSLTARQTTLFERVNKQVNEIDQLAFDGAIPLQNQEWLQKDLHAFNSSLQAFINGGSLHDHEGDYIAIDPAEGEQLKRLRKLDTVWAPVPAALARLSDRASDPAIAAGDALTYLQTQQTPIIVLLQTIYQAQREHTHKLVNRLRIIQTLGLAFALANFVIILFILLRNLRRGDQHLENIQHENQEILDSVSEGLFLLDSDLRMGSQYSAALPNILRCRIEPNASFRDVLAKIVPETTLITATEYLELLFAKHIKEALVGDLNPLDKVEVFFDQGIGSHDIRFLNFQFKRVAVDGEISHLLVTVRDVTDTVSLELELEKVGKQSEQEIELLLNLLHVEPSELAEFLDYAEATLQEVNQNLKVERRSTEEYRSTADKIFIGMHGLKGEAATLGLGAFEKLAHNFEQHLIGLRRKEKLMGNDFLQVAVHLNEMFVRVDLIKELLTRIQGLQTVVTPDQKKQSGVAAHLQLLAQRTAEPLGKKILLSTDLSLIDRLPTEQHQILREVLTQMLRNSLVHGIETPAQRRDQNKSETGLIEVSFRINAQGIAELQYRDDGRGLSSARIRRTLVQSGQLTREDADLLDYKQMLKKVFEPGFSTATRMSRDAGHGVGLGMIKSHVHKLDGRLSVFSREGLFLEFTVRFKAPQLQGMPLQQQVSA